MKRNVILVTVFVQIVVWAVAQDALPTTTEQAVENNALALQQTESECSLSESVRTILTERQKESRRGLSQKDVETLKEVVRRYPHTDASHRARFLIGNMFFSEGRAEDVKEAKHYLTAVMKESTNSVESGLAHVQLLLITARDISDTKQRRAHFKQIQNALNMVLPKVQVLDQQEDETSRLFRRALVWQGEDTLTPRLKLDLSAAAYESGNIEHSLSILDDIVKDYPKTIWAQKAKRRRETIRHPDGSAPK